MVRHDVVRWGFFLLAGLLGLECGIELHQLIGGKGGSHPIVIQVRSDYATHSASSSRDWWRTITITLLNRAFSCSTSTLIPSLLLFIFIYSSSALRKDPILTYGGKCDLQNED
ncbi:hypothetical protein ACFE04_010318 [Oxalis oulophora]